MKRNSGELIVMELDRRFNLLKCNKKKLETLKLLKQEFAYVLKLLKMKREFANAIELRDFNLYPNRKMKRELRKMKRELICIPCIRRLGNLLQ